MSVVIYLFFLLFILLFHTYNRMWSLCVYIRNIVISKLFLLMIGISLLFLFSFFIFSMINYLSITCMHIHKNPSEREVLEWRFFQYFQEITWWGEQSCVLYSNYVSSALQSLFSAAFNSKIRNFFSLFIHSLKSFCSYD